MHLLQRVTTVILAATCVCLLNSGAQGQPVAGPPRGDIPDKTYYGEDDSKLRGRVMYLFEMSTRMLNYIRDHPDSGIADEVLFLYGQKLEYMGKLDKAKEVYKECKEKYPDRVFWKLPYLWRGFVMEEEAQVAQLYLKYIETHPSYTSDMCRLELGLYDEIIERHPNGEWAEEDSKQAFKISREFFRPYEQAVLKKIESYLKEDDVESAIELTNKLRSLYPKSGSLSSALFAIARYYKKSGDAENAVKTVDEALALGDEQSKMLEEAGLQGIASHWKSSRSAVEEEFQEARKQLESRPQVTPPDDDTPPPSDERPNGPSDRTPETGDGEDAASTDDGKWFVSNSHWIVIGVIALTVIVVAAVLLKKRK